MSIINLYFIFFHLSIISVIATEYNTGLIFGVNVGRLVDKSMKADAHFYPGFMLAITQGLDIDPNFGFEVSTELWRKGCISDPYEGGPSLERMVSRTLHLTVPIRLRSFYFTRKNTFLPILYIGPYLDIFLGSAFGSIDSNPLIWHWYSSNIENHIGFGLSAASGWEMPFKNQRLVFELEGVFSLVPSFITRDIAIAAKIKYFIHYGKGK